MPNNLWFPALKTISPYYAVGTQLWRVCTKTANTYNNVLTSEVAFQYYEDFATFNFLSNTSYVTLFHIGSDSTSAGFQVCLRKTSTSSNDLFIGLRYSSGTAWSEVSGSFYSIPNYKSEGTYFMFQYNISATTVNFYVVNLNTTSKTTYDFAYTTTSFPTFGAPGGQWGFGSPPETIASTGVNTSASEGYVTNEGYNSYIAQNMIVNHFRTWNTVVPVSSSNATTYAMFNSASSLYSLYDIMKNNTQLPYGVANLNFQMKVPQANFILANISNSAITPEQLVTLTDNTSNYPTLNP